MPKDVTKNVDRYKVRGGELNEFDFHQNQEQFVEPRRLPTELIPGTPPEAKKAVRVATKSTATKATKAARGKGASAKKPAAKKAAKKSAKKAAKKK